MSSWLRNSSAKDLDMQLQETLSRVQAEFQTSFDDSRSGIVQFGESVRASATSVQADLQIGFDDSRTGITQLGESLLESVHTVAQSIAVGNGEEASSHNVWGSILSHPTEDGQTTNGSVTGDHAIKSIAELVEDGRTSIAQLGETICASAQTIGIDNGNGGGRTQPVTRSVAATGSPGDRSNDTVSFLDYWTTNAGDWLGDWLGPSSLPNASTTNKDGTAGGEKQPRDTPRRVSMKSIFNPKGTSLASKARFMDGWCGSQKLFEQIDAARVEAGASLPLPVAPCEPAIEPAIEPATEPAIVEDEGFNEVTQVTCVGQDQTHGLPKTSRARSFCDWVNSRQPLWRFDPAGDGLAWDFPQTKAEKRELLFLNLLAEGNAMKVECAGLQNELEHRNSELERYRSSSQSDS